MSDSSPEIDDDAMAQMMGFSAFGTQAKDKPMNEKKRKREAGSAANAIPIGVRKPRATQEQSTDTSEHGKDSSSEVKAQTTATTHDLATWRRGVHNERGDIAYFMPSFIQDPWKHLHNDKI